MQAAADHSSIDRLCDQASKILAAGRIGAARPLLAALRRIAPPSPRLSEMTAELALQEGRAADARAELDAAIAAWPREAGLRTRRAELWRIAGALREAAIDAADAVLLAPDRPEPKAVLGAALLGLGQVADGTACLSEALAAQPGNLLVRLALADAQAIGGDPDAARDTLAEGIRAAPDDISVRKAAIMLAIQNDRHEEALELAEAAQAAGLVDALLLGLCGHARSCLGRHHEAAQAYADAFKLGPNDPYVRHLVAASGLLPESEAAPPAYVKAVFDGYAPRFEAHLLALGYRIPGLIRAALLRHSGIGQGDCLGPTLDLGCGTGLVGVALIGLPIGRLTGVDLSAQMLAVARAKNLYAELHESEVLAFLSSEGPRYRAILAGDVFCYLGAVHPVLAAARQRLEPGGLMVFSVERMQAAATPAGWKLERHGRYVHTADYTHRAAAEAGFSILEMREEDLRNEGGTPVAGLIVALRA